MPAQFTLTLDALPLDQAETLSELLERSEPSPVALTINETDEARALWNVVAYFEDEATAYGLARALKLKHVAVAAVSEIDWVRRSLDGLAPLNVGRFYLYGSHDRARRRSGGIALEIDAGTAFGTGHHGTTSGCLLALDAIVKRKSPRRILDLGCGTGVLALAAAKALRRPVIASDIDPVAVAVTRANARNNAALPLVEAIAAPGLKHHRIADSGPYDLIFANILARPLIALAGDLAQSLAPRGTLILSGLTRDQERAVRAAYRNRGLTPASPIRIGNWSTLVFAKAGSRKAADFSGQSLRFKSAKRPQRFRCRRFVGSTAGGGGA